jgi:hypothetical protein
MAMAVNRRVIAVAATGAIGAAVTGCGSSPTPPAPASVTAPARQQAIDDHDSSVDRELAAMHQAAVAGNPIAVTGTQQRLERLAHTDPAPNAKSSAHDPFERMVDDIAFKRAPLFIQQVTTTARDHRVYVSVDRPTFCLMTPEARRDAVQRAYGPTDRRLRADGVTDLQYVVVGLSPTGAAFDRALAVRERGRVRLTGRGRRC